MYKFSKNLLLFFLEKCSNIYVNLYFEVCMAINNTVKNIRFPDNTSELREIKSKLQEISKISKVISKIPNCVGALNKTRTCKHVSPLMEWAVFMNLHLLAERHNFYSLKTSMKAFAAANIRLHVVEYVLLLIYISYCEVT